MDYKFLDKVVDQIITETRIDYDMGKIQFPFLPLSSFPLSPLLLHPPIYPFSTFSSFSDHCKNVYGLKGIEVEYVWEEYVQIIKDKIDSNGL
jgi:hypothetical protein